MNAQKYLDRKADTSEFTRIDKPMHKECVASIIIPAYNEEETIIKTLKSLENQTNIEPEAVEVIVVVNNTTDKTVEELNKFIGGNRRLKYIIVEKNFPPQSAGVGPARKLGCDLAIYRNIHRKKPKRPFYLLWLDADNWRIPHDYVAEVLKVFKETGAHATAARISFDYENLSKRHQTVGLLYEMKQGLEEVAKEYGFTNKDRADAVMHTPGAACGFTQQAYLKIGGTPKNKKTSEDTYMSDEINKYGGKIARVERTIYINPRRMLVEPIAWYNNSAWKQDKFFKMNELARKGIVSNQLPSKEELEKVINDRLEGVAKMIVKRDKADYEEILDELKQKYKEKINLDSYYE